MADYDLFQIEITRNYTKNEWREDVKKVAEMIFRCYSSIIHFTTILTTVKKIQPGASKLV